MTYQELVTTKLKNKSVEFLKDMVSGLEDNLSSEANDILSACLDLIESKLSEDEFIAYCETV